MSKIESPVSERIKILLDKLASGNKAELGRAAGVSGQAIADLIGGQKGGPSFSVVQKLLRSFPDLSERWLLLGEGEMLKPDPLKPQVQKDSSYMPRKGAPEPGLTAGLASQLPTQEQPGFGEINIGVPPAKKQQPVGTDLIKQVARNTADIQQLFEMLRGGGASINPEAPNGNTPDPATRH